MQISRVIVLRFSVFMAIVAWLGLVVSALFILFGKINNMPLELGDEIPKIFYILFLAGLLIYYRYKIDKADSVNFLDLLWRVFMTGLLAAAIVVSVIAFFYLMSGNKFIQNLLVVNFFYLINIGIISAFLVSTFIVWKRLILYQKSKKLLIYWRTFEYSLMGSIFFSFSGIQLFDTIFNVVLVLLVIMGLALAFNLKWIAYLNFKQKLRSVLMLALLVLYLIFFVNNLLNFSSEFPLQLNILNYVTLLALITFILLYALISLLVMLFNLPTSSVFEQKIGEVLNFQRLSQSIQLGYDEKKVYEILLDIVINTVFANAAWLETYDDEGAIKNNLRYNLTEEKEKELKNEIGESKLKKYIKETQLSRINPNKLIAKLKDAEFKSVVIIPLVVKEHEIGRIILLKDVSDGFTNEMLEIIVSFVNQACISLENLQLLQEELETQRYKEELKIASEVQRNLLPKDSGPYKGFDLAVFSESADEVGGDYYDIYHVSDNQTAVIIGDVSGKGTSAAFQMAQMKGIFHSLVELGTMPSLFFKIANAALSRCLNSKTFITASYYLIDTAEKKVNYARAGHCPTIIYHAKDKRALFLKSEGMGLGILRDDSYVNYIEEHTISFEKGDILMLYTDGIVEARNNEGREFGYKKLATLLQEYADLSPIFIKKNIINELHRFCESDDVKDDYTIMVIKFT